MKFRPQILISLFLVLFFQFGFGCKNFENLGNSLLRSIDSTPNLDGLEKLTQKAWRKCLSCDCVKKRDTEFTDEELAKVKDMNAGLLGLEDTQKVLTEEQKAELVKEDGDLDTPGNELCLACYGVLKNGKLSKFVHRDGTIHYGYCYGCLEQGLNLWSRTICPMCRQECETKNCALVDDTDVVYYDSSIVSAFLSSLAMTVLSIDLTMRNPGMGYGTYVGEAGYGEKFTKILTMFDAQQIARDMWGYITLAQLCFLIASRNSVGLLLNKKGLVYYLIPIFTFIAQQADALNFASGISIAMISLYVADLYIFGKGWLSSKRFALYYDRYPHVAICKDNNLMRLDPCSKFCAYLGSNAMNFMAIGSLATIVNETILDPNGKGMGGVIEIVQRAMHASILGVTPSSGWSMFLVVMNICFALTIFLVNVVARYKLNVPTLTFKEFGFIGLASFLTTHSTHLAGNIMGTSIVIEVVMLILICCMLLRCGV